MRPATERLLETLHRLRRDRRTAPAILAAATVVSAVLILQVGRGTTFSGDEVVWVAATPGLDPYIVFQPHGGHLIATTRLVYWPLLEVFGLAYLPFRMLSVGAILLTVWLLFSYGRRRADAFVALAPCLVLLFFGSDYLHLFQGNGFTVMLALALGIAALLAFERGDRRGDLLACLWLSIGVLTYTVILPFIAGLGLAILLNRDRWSRIWVVLVPSAIYGFWRLWLALADVTTNGGGVDLANLAKIPAWCFQSMAGVLNALSGLSYPFSGVSLATPVELAGPPLALLALFLLGRHLSKRGLGLGLAIALTVALTLFSLQAMAAITDQALRLPGSDARYMYPGAIALILAGYELARGWRPGRSALVALAAITVTGVGSNLALMGDNAGIVRDSGEQLRAFTGAIGLAIEAGPDEEAVVDYRTVGDHPVLAQRGMALQDYGRFAYGPGRLSRQSEERRKAMDILVATAAGFGPATVTPPLRACVRRKANPDGIVSFRTGPARLVLNSPAGGPVEIGRFADRPTVTVGTLEPGVDSELTLPSDPAPDPWQVAYTGAELEVCVSDD